MEVIKWHAISAAASSAVLIGESQRLVSVEKGLEEKSVSDAIEVQKLRLGLSKTSTALRSRVANNARKEVNFRVVTEMKSKRW